MAIFKCKMCGDILEFNIGDTVCTCESCGTMQTLPRLDDDKKANLYDRANHFRRNNEYDKAMGIYEQILNEDNTDSEAYWSLVLCRYGIEYVEDPATHKRVPTVNRAQYTSIFADEDYKSAIEHSDLSQKAIYENEAKAIDEIQKGILEISQKEEPFDVFICYKETDNNGRRTPDSVLANDLYHQLVQEGFKVFFARITLEDKLGQEYEPYIFAALNSSKVMVVLGTKPEHFNAVWVKNEWSRFLALIKKGEKKILIPAYKDMDPYDLPEEFSHLQAQDMSKLGFMQDLIRGIKKIASNEESKVTIKEMSVSGNTTNVDPLLKRAFIFLEDGEWQNANEYCEKVLDQDPENAQAYLGKLLVELHIRSKEELKDCTDPFDDNNNYMKIIRFGEESLVKELSGYNQCIRERNEKTRFAAENKAEEVIAAWEAFFNSSKQYDQKEELKNNEEKQDELINRRDAVLNLLQRQELTEQRLNALENKITELQNKQQSLGLFARKEKAEIAVQIQRTIAEQDKLTKEKREIIEKLKGCPDISQLEEQIDVCSDQIEKLKDDIQEIENKVSMKMKEAQLYYKDAAVREEVIKREPWCAFYFAEPNEEVVFGDYHGIIEWKILEKSDDKLLLISKYGLDAVQFNEKRFHTSWGSCTLRTWLNSTFLEEVFSPEEQQLIAETNVTAEMNPEYNTNPGPNTIDKIFLLSISEANKYFSSNKERICAPIEYAKRKRASINVLGQTAGEKPTCYWWLRSPGCNDESIALVGEEGDIYYNGDEASRPPFNLFGNLWAVRPALWIKLKP